MGDAGKVPLDLQLATSVPLAIRAYRRRFISPCTNLQTAGPDDYVNIYPDTSTPGSFIDPESTYLSFDFEITNSQYSVDYTDFGVEGVGGGLIQDWRVYNQGSILEEILEYGTVSSAMANMEGSYELEVSMYFSSKLKEGFQENMHRNFIKPPMVDSSGNILGGPNPFGLSSSTMSESSTLYANAGTINEQGASQLLTHSGISQVGQIVDSASAPVPSTLLAAGFFDTNQLGQVTSMPPYVNNLAVLGLPTWLNGATGTDVNIARITPVDFPDHFTPSLVEIVRNYTAEFGTINKPQVMANLCNVKCYPIGQTSAYSNFSTDGANAKLRYDGTTFMAAVTDAKSGDPAAKKTTYRICYRPYSGIFGKLATKMLATTLLSPQQMYINIHLASASTALNVSADPCRRITGTIRDFIRNIGTGNGCEYGATEYSKTSGNPNIYQYLTSAYAPGYGPFHCIPLKTGTAFNTRAGPSTIFSSAAACGQSQVCGTMGVIDADETGAGAQSLSATGASAHWGITTKSQNLPPTPQYMPCKTPWNYNSMSEVSAVVVNYANESEVFYGTYMRHSVPQTARIFDLSWDGTAPSSGKPRTGLFQNGKINYTLSNINLVGDQLILPNEVTADIIMQAEAGNFNVHTNSIRTYNLQVQNSATQSIICPIKVNMAKRVMFVFQDTLARNAGTGILYDSNCGLNPFASIRTSVANTTDDMAVIDGFNSGSATGTATAKVYGCGYKTPLVYTPTKTSGSDIQLQLRIGNDFYPPQPLGSMQEIAVELVKTLEGWSSSTFSPIVDGEILSGGQYNCLQPNKFVTAFVDNALLDDQTITQNTDMVPLYCNKGIDTISAAAGIVDATAGAKTTSKNGYNYLSPRGFCVPGLFKSPSSRFLLGFNMRSFKSSDGVDGGMYLGNNTITLIMSGAVGLNVPNRSYRGIAIVPHRVAMRYSPGGQIVWAY